MLQIPKYKLENKYRYVVINHLCCVNRRRCQVGRTYVAIWTGKTQARCLPLDFLLLLNIVIIVLEPEKLDVCRLGVGDTNRMIHREGDVWVLKKHGP